MHHSIRGGQIWFLLLDLNKFFHALKSEQLINAASLTKMRTVASVSWDYGYGLEYYDIDGDDYYGHSGDVGNTSGLFFCDISTTAFPEGYYVAYNYTYEGVSPYNVLDKPLHDMMLNFVPGPDDTVTTPVGIAHLDQSDMTVSLFPNPAMDYVNISSSHQGNASVKLVDISGRIIWEASFEGHNLTIPLSNVESGMYVVQLSTEGVMLHQKLAVR